MAARSVITFIVSVWCLGLKCRLAEVNSKLWRMACLCIIGVLKMNQTAVIEVLVGLVVYLLFEAEALAGVVA
jgi:hypothetical protein